MVCYISKLDHYSEHRSCEMLILNENLKTLVRSTCLSLACLAIQKLWGRFKFQTGHPQHTLYKSIENESTQLWYSCILVYYSTSVWLCKSWNEFVLMSCIFPGQTLIWYYGPHPISGAPELIQLIFTLPEYACIHVSI